MQELRDLAADVSAILGPGTEGRLRGRLVGVLRAPAGRRLGRRVLPPRPALGGRAHRFRRHRQLHAALRLARRLGPSRRAGLAGDPRPRLPAIQHRGRRGLRLVLRQRRRPRRPDPHGHHRRRRQAVGLPLQGHPLLVGEPARQPAGRRGERRRDGMGAALEADPLHRVRLSRDRPRAEPAERVLRPEELGELRAALLARLAGRRDPARLPRGVPALLERPGPQSGLAGLRRQDGRDGRERRLDLGRAALSVLPRPHRRLDRRRELAARALAHRPARARCRSRRSSATSACGPGSPRS